ncbi:hypothetical protein [Pseudomonas yamanorum]|jgi:uncharacterized protein YaaW (UPF0174 family)|uniref:hypothetical protein n=1 Tax=Pseudomonas yamanorum TaxID=515393 RepID=UPI002ED123DD|nr:hypothetical protein VYI69_06710 [Pseudomonas yamanorum]
MMSIEQLECDSELLAGLSKGKASELDVLVDVITDFGRGRGGLDAATKKALVMAKHSSSPDRYSQALLNGMGRELQQFGGHSGMNVARRLLDKPLVPYREIVDDVYKKLNGKSSGQNTLAQKEREIALALFGASWRELTPQERYDRSVNAKVLTGFFQMSDALSVDAKGSAMAVSASASAALFTVVTTGLRFNPVGMLATVGLGIHGAASEAYRVTVPFVAQLGWMRLRQEAEAAEPAPQVLSGNSQAVALNVANPDLVLSDEAGGTLMKLNVFNVMPVSSGRAMSTDQVSTLNALLTNVPGLAALAELQGGNYVMCSLPFESLANSAGQEGAKRAWVTAGGHISEHANLTSPEGLQNVLISGAVWNVVSSAVGQKHLHDISEKLTAIKLQLDELQDSIQRLRWDKLHGLADYVQSLLDHFPNEGVPNHALHHLESRLVDIAELEQYFLGEINNEIQRAEKIETGKLFSGDASRIALRESLSNMTSWVGGYTQASQLRVVSYALLDTAAPSQRYRSEASKVLKSLERLASIATESRQVYSAQMELTNSLMFSASAAQNQQFSEQLASLAINLEGAPVLTQQLHQTLFDQADRRVLLHLENGKFTQGRLLDAI